MVTEDYVSFEVAKLLKEKGFEGVINAYYHIWDNGNEVCSIQEYNHSEAPHLYISAPTHQIALKWLREVHKIYIDIPTTYSEVEKTMHFIWQIYNSEYDGVGDCEIFYDKYEDACEEAIKYSLENLI